MIKQQGFSLVEVVISLSILGLAITGSSQLIQRGYQHIQLSQQTHDAAFFAHSFFNQLHTAKELTAGITNGQHNKQLKWQLQLSKINNQNVNVAGFNADLTIWDGLQRQHHFHSILIRNNDHAAKQ